MSEKNYELSPKELQQRTAILRRFKELLKAQRDRFRAYLEILEKQKDKIEKGSTDSLIRHVELEEKIVEDIIMMQKVINPLEDLYRSTFKEPIQDNDELIDLKSALEGLKTEAVSRSKRNKLLLSKRMTELRSEIKNLRSSPYVRPQSVYSDSGIPSMVDLQG